MNKMAQDDHEESSNKENQHAVDVAAASAVNDGGGRLSDVEIMSLSFNALEHLRWLSLRSLSTKNIFFKMRVLDISHNGIKDLSGLEAVSNSLEILRANDNLLTTLPKQWEQQNGDVVVFQHLREVW